MRIVIDANADDAAGDDAADGGADDDYFDDDVADARDNRSQHDANDEMTCDENRRIGILQKESRIAVGHRGAEVTHRFPGS